MPILLNRRTDSDWNGRRPDWRDVIYVVRALCIDPTRALPLRKRLGPIQDRALVRPATWLEADESFFYELSDDA